MNDAPSPHRGVAFGAPGMPPRWASSSKDGVGTAYSASSRVWFTISHGILNEIYYPTIDRPQVRDCGLLITDGETFCHEEKRHLRHEVECMEPDALGYRIVSADPQGRYRLVKEIIADPHDACVLVRAGLEAEAEWRDRLKVYVLLTPHIGVGGWGNSARRISSCGRDVLVAWKGGTHLALGADVGFARASCGYVGRSDGWQDLMDDFRMDWEFDCAEDGNLGIMGQLDLSGGDEVTIAIAFGDSLHAAVTALQQCLAEPYEGNRERFIEQWRRVCCHIPDIARASGDGGRLYRTSRSLLLAHEDKTFAGAMIASASIPWGNAKGDEDLGGYHLVWTRDMVHSATALLACGDEVTPRRALVYLACSQRADGGFPQNFWLDGTPYWGGIQLDQVAFPIMLAWRLQEADALDGFDPYPMVRAGAAYLIRQGPMTQQERWEENSGYSPSTLAASIAALICAADFARDEGDEATAVFLEEYADFLESHIEKWTVTTAGSLLPDVPRHYIRIHPTDIDDVAPDEDPNHGVLEVANRRPGAQRLFPARDVVDAGFLELVRYGIRRPDDVIIADSLRVVDAVLKVDTPVGPCWRRYTHDGYGPQNDGAPYSGWGKGRAWPILTGERGHYELAAGRDVRPYIRAMEGFACGCGMMPEQIWDEADRPERRMYLGRPAGSAMPLMWAHAEYVKLLRSVADDRVFDRLSVVADKYLRGLGRKDLEVWKPIRQVRQVTRGHVLRVQAPTVFRLRWTADEWQSWRDTDSSPTGLDIGFVDIPIGKRQRAPVRFTFYWTEDGRWEGRDYVVNVTDE
ncbi:MAG: glycoside hydrolase family 15 protein [Armatimonadota bacterium]